MKYLFAVMALLLHAYNSQAQLSCGSQAADAALRASDPHYDALRRQADSLIKLNTNNAPPAGGSNDLLVGGIHYIPVVVHIIHTGEAIGTQYNPTDQQVIDYIEVLNQGLAASFPGYPSPNTGGQDVPIRFVLAQRTPDCNPTNGIVRKDASMLLTSTDLTNYNQFGVSINSALMVPGIPYETLADLSHWPNLEYYNIYLVKSIFGYGGFAFFPTGTATIYDAAIITVTDVTAPQQQPDLVAHEVGHSFGLAHTFEGGSVSTCPPNSDCNNEGDLICDTEPHMQYTNGCDVNAINPCTNMPYGDVVINYMSYSCCTKFTAGQKARMMSTMTSLRTALDNSLGATSLALVPPGPAMPAPTISISTPQTSYCAGGTAQFTAATTYAGINPVYQWRVNGTPVGSNSPIFTTTTLNDGDVVSCDLTSSYSSSCLTNNFATSNSITVSVSSTPSPAITITTPTLTVCQTTPVTVTATVTNPGPGLPIFQWYMNGTYTGYSTGTGSLTSTYTFYPNQGAVVSCKVLANSVCSASPWYTSNELAFIVGQSYWPVMSITASDTMVCEGDIVSLEAVVNGAGLNPSINWYQVGVPVSIGSGTGPITLTLTDTTQVYLAVDVSGQCAPSAPVISDTLQINVLPFEAPLASISTADTNFCSGSAVSVMASTVSAGDNPGYEWMVNNLSAGVHTQTFSFTPADNDVVTCEVTTSYLCPAATTGLSNELTFVERDTVLANGVIVYGANAGCEGDTVILANVWSHLDTNIASSRQWMANGVAVGNGDTLLYILAAGVNDLSFSSSFPYVPHCMTAASHEWYTESFAATPHSPTPTITHNGTHLSSNYPDGQNQWYAVGTGLLPGEVNQDFYPSFSGWFYVIANSNGCPSLPSDTLQFDPVSVPGVQLPQMEFYPNPSAEAVFYTPAALIGREAVVMNDMGQVVLQTRLGERLSLAGMATGVYFVRVATDEGQRTFRLLSGQGD